MPVNFDAPCETGSRGAAHGPDNGPHGQCDRHGASRAAGTGRGQPHAARSSASWPPSAGSSRSPGGCSPTPRPRSGSTASSPATGPARSCCESAENGRSWSRWSFVGRAQRRRAHRARRRGALDRQPARSACRAGGDPLEALRETVELLHTEPLPGLPPLTGGMVGYLGYDAVRRLERLPELTDRRPAAARAGRCCSPPTWPRSTTTRARSR